MNGDDEKQERIEKTISKMDELIQSIRSTHEAVGPEEPELRAKESGEELYIGGKWVRSELSFPVYTYYGKVIRNVALAKRPDAERAVEHAHSYKEVLHHTKLKERSEILRNCAHRLEVEKASLARMHTKQTGQPLSVSLREIDQTIEVFKAFARRIDHFEETFKRDEEEIEIIYMEPVGVTVAFTPWYQSVFLPGCVIASAIATGSPLILVPHRKCAVTALELTKFFVQSSMSLGNLNVICGDEKDLVKYFAEDAKVAQIIYYGFREEAKHFGGEGGAGLKKLHVETPKHNTAIVCSDAALEDAADKIVRHMASSIFPTVIFIEQEVYGPFVKMLQNKILKMKTGDPLDKDTSLWTFDDKTLGIITSQVDSFLKKPIFGGRASDGKLLPGIYGGGEYNPRLVGAVTVGQFLLTFTSTDMSFALHYAQKVRSDNAMIFTTHLQKAFSAAKDLDAKQVFVNELPEPDYGELLSLMSSRKRILMRDLLI